MPTVDKALLKTLRAEIDAALVDVAKRHGLKTLHAGGCSFMSGAFTFKLEGVLEGGLDKDAERYNATAPMFGWPALGSTFTNGGNAYKIVGCNTTGSKIIAEREGGKRFLFDAEAAAALVKAQAAKGA